MSDYTTLHPVESNPGWRWKVCGNCRGTGTIGKFIGLDHVPADCEACGSGIVYVSPAGRHAVYPGGPFTGGREVAA